MESLSNKRRWETFLLFFVLNISMTFQRSIILLRSGMGLTSVSTSIDWIFCMPFLTRDGRKRVTLLSLGQSSRPLSCVGGDAEIRTVTDVARHYNIEFKMNSPRQGYRSVSQSFCIIDVQQSRLRHFNPLRWNDKWIGQGFPSCFNGCSIPEWIAIPTVFWAPYHLTCVRMCMPKTVSQTTR